MHWIYSHICIKIEYGVYLGGSDRIELAVLMSLNSRLIRLVDVESSAKTKIRPTTKIVALRGRHWRWQHIAYQNDTIMVLSQSFVILSCVCVSVGERATHYTGANRKWHTLRPSAW